MWQCQLLWATVPGTRLDQTCRDYTPKHVADITWKGLKNEASACTVTMTFLQRILKVNLMSCFL